MTSSFFITGTDTEIGKTHTTCALLAKGIEGGWRVAGLKPVAAGTDASGHNEDVLRLIDASNVPLTLQVVNPWLLPAPLSPHIAARQAGIEITLPSIVESLQAAQAAADLVLVEGVGGLYAPLSDTLTQPDLVRALDLPVILVVGLRLGCLNHALLTAAAIQHEGLSFAGWVGNHIDEKFQAAKENLETLCRHIPAPCLGVIPFAPNTNATSLASYITLPQ